MEELIEVAKTPSRPSRALRAASALAACGLILWTGAAELIDPPPPPRLVGMERIEEERLHSSMRFLDGTRARYAERTFKLRGHVRRKLSPYWSYVMYRLREVDTTKTLAGKDGWLFIRSRALLRQREYPSNIAILSNLYGALHRQLGACGSELVMIPLPRKAVAAESMLPNGLDVDPAFDREVIDQLDDRGMVTLDLLETWRSMPPESTYLRHDSHWAFPARVEVARALKAAIPAFAEPGFKAWLGFGKERIRAGILHQEGISVKHPIYGLIDSQVEHEARLLPKHVVPNLQSGEFETKAMLVGSSFSAGFDLGVMLVGLLNVGLEDRSERGRPPFVSLAKALSNRLPKEIPPYVLSEFPIYQAATIHPRAQGTTVASTQLFVHLGEYVPYRDLEGMEPLTAAVVKEGGDLVALFPDGVLASSGDGVISIVIDFDCESPTVWKLQTNGAVHQLRIPEGKHTRILPLVESEKMTGRCLLASVGSVKGMATATMKAVLDVDQGRPLTVDVRPDGALAHAAPMAVRPLDVLLFDWNPVAKTAIHVHAKGVDAIGEPVSKHWRCGGAKSFAGFSLGPFEGGEIRELVLEGMPEDVNVRLASKLRRSPEDVPK